MPATSIKVLAVDDEPDLCLLTKRFLEKSEGMEVDIAGSAEEAVKALATTHYDAIVSDYQMPDEDGIAFLKRLRLKKNDIPFILFTGRGREEVVIEALNNGADSYLQKGGNPVPQYAELEHRIRGLVQRSRTVKAKLEDEERFKQLADGTDEWIWEVDANGLLTYCNQVVERILGYNPEELIGKVHFFDLKPPENREQIKEKIFAAFEAKLPIRAFINYGLTKSGEVVLLETSGIPVLDESGRLIGYRGINKDVTERKRVEDALKASQNLMSKIMATTPTLVYIYDLKEHRNTYVNHNLERFLGYTPEQVQEMGSSLFQNILHPDDAEAVEIYQKGLRQLKDGEIREEKYRMKRSNGSWCWLRSQDIVFERDLDGSVRSELGIAEDVTEQKHAEDELNKAHSQLRQAMELAKMSHWEYDVASDTFSFDDQFYALLGTTAEREGGTEMRSAEYVKRFIPPEDAPKVRIEIEKALSAKDPHFSLRIEHDIIRRDGERRTIAVIHTAVKDPSGRTIKTHGVNQDITERKRADLELGNTREQLEEAHHLAKIGTWDWLTETDSVVWSEELFRIAGRDHSLPAPSLAEQKQYYTSTSWNTLNTAVGVALATGEPYHLELEMVRMDASKRQVIAIGTAKLDINGKVIGLHGLVQDVTEHRKAEEELKQAIAMLESAMDQSTAGIAIADAPDGKFRYVNDSGLLIRGGDRKAVVNGVGIDQYVVSWQLLDLDGTPLKSDDVPLTRAIKFGETCSRELIVRRTTDDDRAVIAHAAPIKDRDGNVAAGIVVFTDITERRQAELALFDSEEKFRSLAESSQDYIMRYDRQFRHTYMNPAALRVSGLTDDRIIGKTHREAGFEDGLSSFWEEKLAQVFEEGQPFQTQFSWESVDGPIVLDWKLSPEFAKDGTVRSILGVSRDITQITKATDELRKKNEELVASHEETKISQDILNQKLDELTRAESALMSVNRKLNLLSSITRHDINNKAMTIQGHLVLLKMNHPDLEFNEQVQTINREAGQISSMIRFTKEYENIGVNAPIWHDIQKLVGQSTYGELLGGINVVYDIPVGPSVYADPLIVKVFHNLIQNALRHSKNATAIRFYLEDRDGSKAIVCEDNGMGISVDMKRRLFTKGIDEDHGFGLFLSKEILSITGITITEEGEPGRGAKFVMMVPSGGIRVTSES